MNLFAGSEFTAALGKYFPGLIGQLAQKQSFPTPASPRPPSDQTGRHHSRVVEHEHIARIQQLWQFIKNVMLDGLRGSPNHEQSRFVPLRARLLGDELRRKVVIEEIGAHATSLRLRHRPSMD